MLPQIFHVAGKLSGLGTTLGVAFLPMHFGVLIAGLLSGPVVGLVTGIVSPIISNMMSGMPTTAMLPLMIIELAGYGLAAGLLSGRHMPVFLKLLIAQIVGRAVRALAILVLIYAFRNEHYALAQTWNIVMSGLCGILLQWAFIPLLMYRLKNLSGKK